MPSEPPSVALEQQPPKQDLNSKLPFSSLSPASSSIIAASLPTEVLLRIFGHLDSPLDLYRASRANKRWRGIAIDPRLWETHYWAFYRASYAPQNDDGRLLLARRTFTRHRAMRAWIDRSTAYSPKSPVGPLITGTAIGIKFFEPLFRGYMLLSSMQGPDETRATRDRLYELAQDYDEEGPNDPQEAAQRIIDTLIQESGKSPTPEQRAAGNQKGDRWKELERISFEAKRPPPYPAFLANRNAAPHQMPDFSALFAKRMNADEALLLVLRSHISLEQGSTDSALRLAEQYGDGCRELLAAICMDQQLTPESLSLEHCLSLYYHAQQLLGHLQRREAVQSLQRLSEPLDPPTETLPLRERILRASVSAEEVLASFSLFRSGDKGEVTEYLDLLALWVWADLDSRARYDEYFIELFTKDNTDADHEYDVDMHDNTPQGSTRLFMTRIERSLRRIGFCVNSITMDEVDPVEPYDFDDYYINTSMFCPAQRSTSSLTYTVILCSVARRLGVAGTLIDTPAEATAIVWEDGVEPAGWEGEDKQEGEEKDWSHFVYMPSVDGRFILMEACRLVNNAAEIGESPSLDPASSLQVLRRAIQDMRHNRHGQRPPGWLDDRREATEIHTTSRTSVRELRAYLQGRHTTLPSPLLPAFLPSTLAFLPPTKAGAPRAKPEGLKELTAYATWWAHSFTSSFKLYKGELRIDRRICDTISSDVDPSFRCDLAILLQVHVGSVKEELEEARQLLGKGGSSSTSSLRRSQPGSELLVVKQFVANLLRLDCRPNEGVEGDPRDGGKAKELTRGTHELLSIGGAARHEVEHCIGTVFTHRTSGVRGVIVGRDSIGDVGKARDADLDVTALGQNGLDQPFYTVYYENKSEGYVAQCDVESSRIPAGSTAEEAAAILREYVPLFTLRRVMRCFRTIQVSPWKARKAEGEEGKVCGKEEGGEGGGGGGGGAIKMIMNPWMRAAWPFG